MIKNFTKGKSLILGLSLIVVILITVSECYSGDQVSEEDRVVKLVNEQTKILAMEYQKRNYALIKEIDAMKRALNKVVTTQNNLIRRMDQQNEEIEALKEAIKNQ